MKFLKIKSYAKINLSLNVIGKLKSKLHKIESLVTFVNLYDLIYLRNISKNNTKFILWKIFKRNNSKKKYYF